MKTTRDKFLTEYVLNECNHAWTVIASPAGWVGICNYCPKCQKKRVKQEIGTRDFSTGNNFIKLWNAAKEKDWWPTFVQVQHIKVKHRMYEEHLWLDQFINPDTFADKLYCFLKDIPHGKSRTEPGRNESLNSLY